MSARLTGSEHADLRRFTGFGFSAGLIDAVEAILAARLAEQAEQIASLTAERDKANAQHDRMYDLYTRTYQRWLILAHPWCICEEGPYFGAQLAGTPLRCERCGRNEADQ